MAKKLILSGFLSSLLLVSLIAYSLPAFAQGPDFTNGKPDIIAATGIAPGKDLIVHVIVVVQPGETRNEAAIAALAHQGARPFTSEEFSTIALYWDQFGDSDPGNDRVVQNYNDKDEPANVNGKQALLNTHNSWNEVATSNFTFEYGSDTGKCPSLVKECKGRQTFDGNNDVAWLRLSSSSTLGVTWTGTYTDEADMALNTSFDWYTDGTQYYDVETVFLHENGHAAGLGHSNDITAIMYPSYQTLNRDLQSDDKAGISYLYPAPENVDPPTLDGISISPQDGDVNVGSSIQFTLTEDYSDGTHVDVTDSALWSSSNLTAATIDQNGFAQGESVGLATITANYQGNDYDASLTINPAPETPSVLAVVSYDTEGGRLGDKHLVVTVTLEPPLSGISVTSELLRDGESIGSATGTTNSNGVAGFTLKNASSGDYTTNVSVNGIPLTDENTTDPGFKKLT
jgi:hypothetical protein